MICEIIRTKPLKTRSIFHQEWVSAEIDSDEEDNARSALSPERFQQTEVNGVEGLRGDIAGALERQQQQPQRQQVGKGAIEESGTKIEPVEIVAGGATTTFEEQTVWDLTSVSYVNVARCSGVSSAIYCRKMFADAATQWRDSFCCVHMMGMHIFTQLRKCSVCFLPGNAILGQCLQERIASTAASRDQL